MGNPCKGDHDRLTESCGRVAASIIVFHFNLPALFRRLVSYADILVPGEVRHAR
ncbi:hypothetical protein MGWOODY_Smn608 [hydrothermal vent metagenome]|uniref:Uncharacterized protein n=1 Tax=hydrothermal vent metagenome TaxID=652676 RepID=A0A160TJF1_9ZZZZ